MRSLFSVLSDVSIHATRKIRIVSLIIGAGLLCVECGMTSPSAIDGGVNPGSGQCGDPQSLCRVILRTSFAPADDPDWDRDYVDNWSNKQTGIGQSGSGNGGGCCLNEVSAAANNPGGVGGRGWRSYKYDGTNSGPGGNLLLGSFGGVDRLAIRQYLRYSAGFQWTQAVPPAYHKIWHPSVFGPADRSGLLPEWANGLLNIFDGSNHQATTGLWASTYGHPANGSWHYSEFVMSIPEREGYMYLDGRQVGRVNQLSESGTKFYFFLASNQNAVMNGPHYVDYDDIVVANVPAGTPPSGGWIGAYSAGRGF